MSHHFFLSYSRADSSPLLRRFFDDLSDTIRVELNLPHTQAVGFYEEIPYGPTSEWSDAAKQALQDSRVMVCLVSPAYMHSEQAGKEWQVFEMRRRRTLEASEATLPESLAHVILPVKWSRWQGPVPTVVNELLAHPDRIYQRQPLTTLFKSAGMSHREYTEFVKALAHQIIEMMLPSSNLLPLDPLPPMSEVSSAFYLWEEGASDSDQCGERSKKYEVPCWHAELVKRATVAEHGVMNSQVKGTSLTDEPSQSAPATRENQTYYLSYVISDKRKVLDLIDDACLFTPYHVKTYENVENALSDVLSNTSRVPDSFVIDLSTATPALKRLQTFTQEWGLRSTILAVSINFKLYTLKDLCGVTAVIAKLLSGELKPLIKRCAKIGRDRRVYEKKGRKDQSRTKRPVFLSYSHNDKDVATFLSSNLGARNIESWTMDETLNPSDDWFAEIQNGLTDAQIFIALITKSYLTSKHCEEELTNFHDRVQATKAGDRPRLIPVLYNSPDLSINKRISPIVGTYTHVGMKDNDFRDGFDSLMKCIQDVVGNDNDDDLEN